MSVEKKIPRRTFIAACALAGIHLMLPNESAAHTYSPNQEKSRKFDTYIANLTAHIPNIGGVENYFQRLHAGIGFATLHQATIATVINRGEWLREKMKNTKTVYRDLSQQNKNIYDLTEDGEKNISNHFDLNQRHLSVDAALVSKKYVGLISTRSPQDIGSKYLVFGTDVPAYGLRFPQFVGISLVVDCPKQTDWNNRLADWIYNSNGWILPWIADVSDELMCQLPSGYSRNPANTMEGRPGMILISEDRYRSIIN